MESLWDKIKSRLASGKELASMGFADIVGTGIGGAFWLILASLIEPDRYGEINYILSLTGLGFGIALIGVRETITVYTAKKTLLASTLFIISTLFAAVAFTVFSIIFLRFDIGFLILAYVINDLCLGYLIGSRFMTEYSKYVLIQKGLSFCLGFGFFFLFGYQGIVFALALSYIHFIIIYVKVIRKSKMNFSLLKVNWKFITDNYFMSISTILRSNLDKILIVPLLGYSILGNYSLSLQVFAVMMLFPRLVFRYILPYDAIGVENRKLKKLTIVFGVVVAFAGFLLSPIVIPLIFPKFTSAIVSIQIMGFAAISSSINQIQTSKMLSVERSRIVFVSRISSLVVIILGIILLGPAMGDVGIALAFLLSSIALTVSMFIIERLTRQKQ